MLHLLALGALADDDIVDLSLRRHESIPTVDLSRAESEVVAALAAACEYPGFFFLSVPALELFLSAVVSQMVVNLFLLFSGGFIVVQLDPYDIAAIWAYDIAWLLVIDVVKMSINKVQNVEQAAMSSVTSRNSFTAGPRKSSSKTSTRARRHTVRGAFASGSMSSVSDSSQTT